MAQVVGQLHQAGRLLDGAIDGVAFELLQHRRLLDDGQLGAAERRRVAQTAVVVELATGCCMSIRFGGALILVCACYRCAFT